SGRKVDPRTDIWSLGVVFYAMLAGHPPFRDDDDRRLAEAIFYRQPEPLESVRPEGPAELAQLVERMLAKDPAQRPQSMAEVRSGRGVPRVALEITLEPSGPRRARYSGRWRRWAAVALPVVAGLATFGLRPLPQRGALPPTAGRPRPSIAVLPF